MQVDRGTALWAAGAATVLGLWWSPAKLATLLLLPLIAVATLVIALAVHLALAFSADWTSARLRGDQPRYDPVVPLLSLATPAGLEAIRTKKRWTHLDTSFRKPLHPNSVKVSAALDRLIALVLKNHLLDWYTISISPSDPTFPNAVEKTIRECLVGVREHLVTVDWAKLGVSTLLPRITTHIELYFQAEQSLTDSESEASGVTSNDQSTRDRKKKKNAASAVPSEELDLLLSNKYAQLTSSKALHAAVSGASFNSRPSEEHHLRKTVMRILKIIMPASEAASPAVMIMAMEIVACAVIRPVIESLSDPDLWNRILDEKAGAAIREQRMVDKLRQALDANPNIPRTPLTAKPKTPSNISIQSTSKEFDGLLKSLSRCPTLLEAKRLRNDIDSSLRRARWADTVEAENPAALARYVDRLQRAAQTIDNRIGELGGQKALRTSTSSDTTASSVTLRDVLHQAGAMAFFMEFMDRRKRMMHAQFYLTIEGLKNPLEEDMDVMQASHSSIASDETSVAVDSITAQSLREDVELLLSTFLNKGTVVVNSAILESLQDFQQQEGERRNMSMSKLLYQTTRQYIFKAQAQSYNDMNEFDWPSFQRSDLFTKALAEMSPISIAPLPRANVPVVRRRASTSLGSPRIEQAELVLPSSASVRSTELPRRVTASNSRIPSGQSITSNRSTSGRGTMPSLDGQFQPVAFKSDRLDFLTGTNDNSMDSEKERLPLFGDDMDSSQTLQDDPDDFEQRQTMEAIHDALSSILASDRDNEETGISAPLSPDRQYTPTSENPSGARPSLLAAKASTKSSSTSFLSRGMSHLRRPLLQERTSSSQSIRDGEGKTGSDDDHTSAEGAPSSGLLLAAPGNLHLPLDVQKLSSRIDRLQNQELVLAALLRKADLTGNDEESKILTKSISALRREITEFSLQKQQLELQSNEKKLLPGRTAVTIADVSIKQSQGKEYALYTVEVHQLAEDGKTETSGWLVSRRFSEFVALQAMLRDKLPETRSLELPQKRLVTSLSKSLLEQRKQGLSAYLSALIKIPAACADPDVRAFLSQQDTSLIGPASAAVNPLLAGLGLDFAPGSDVFPGQGYIRNLFRTVTTGMDDMFGGPSMLDAIIFRLSQQAVDFAGSITPSVQSEDLLSSILGGLGGSSLTAAIPATRQRQVKGENSQIDLLSLSGDLDPVEGEVLTSFTAPIADILLEVFDLKGPGSWIRRSAILLILRQVLGGTIERKVREGVNLAISGDALLPHIEMLSDLLWPDGKPRPPSAPRTAEEKLQTRKSALSHLNSAIPTAAAHFIGRSNAYSGARRVFTVMQNRRLLQHIIYTLLDDILLEVFGQAMREEVQQS